MNDPTGGTHAQRRKNLSAKKFQKKKEINKVLLVLKYLRFNCLANQGFDLDFVEEVGKS